MPICSSLVWGDKLHGSTMVWALFPRGSTVLPDAQCLWPGIYCSLYWSVQNVCRLICALRLPQHVFVYHSHEQLDVSIFEDQVLKPLTRRQGCATAVMERIIRTSTTLTRADNLLGCDVATNWPLLCSCSRYTKYWPSLSHVSNTWKYSRGPKILTCAP